MAFATVNHVVNVTANCLQTLLMEMAHAITVTAHLGNTSQHKKASNHHIVNLPLEMYSFTL